MWNITAKLVQEKFHNEYNINFDPFTGIRFKKAKRKELQAIPSKRKQSASALNHEKLIGTAKIWNEETPA